MNAARRNRWGHRDATMVLVLAAIHHVGHALLDEGGINAKDLGVGQALSPRRRRFTLPRANFSDADYAQTFQWTIDDVPFDFGCNQVSRSACCWPVFAAATRLFVSSFS
jgi:hypothetical protein